MELLITHLINLTLISIFVGVEFAIGFLIHPVLSRLPQSVHIASVQVIGKIVGKIMPIWIPLILFSAVPVLYFISDTQALAFWFIIIGIVCIVLMLIISLTVNVAINKQIISWNSQSPPNNWLNLRKRWDTFHKVRIFLDIVALIAFLLAALI